jgi:FKBP-type peptidyl-prolyl cis-trans isomerase FklB
MMGMKTSRSIPWLTAGAVLALACSQSNAATSTALKSDEAKQSYSLGVAIAQQARASLGEIDTDAFIAGVSDSVKGEALSLDDEQISAALESYDARMTEASAKKRQAQAETNLAEGTAYREDFAAAPGVVTLDSGLQYKVIEAGTGEAAPNTAGKATVHYTAATAGGLEFDSSRERGAPVVVDVEQVMPGWSEALSLMKPGAKWQIVVPPELAYGEQGYGPMIGPNATLVFELELVATS